MPRSFSRGSFTVAGLLLTAVTPIVLVILFRDTLRWYTGAALFYGVIALAQIAYLALLIVAARRRRHETEALSS